MFGIDFGTTNTRIAFYDGETVELVKIRNPDSGVDVANIPTQAGFDEKNGNWHFGFDAEGFKQPKDSMKWMLLRDYPVEEISGTESKELVTLFFHHLKAVVAEARADEYEGQELSHAVLSIPVTFSLEERRALCESVEAAGIVVEQIYYEPVSALYAALRENFRQMPIDENLSGRIAVFDWGGGTLDIAIATIRNGFLYILKRDTLLRGGKDFDQIIVEKAMQDLKSKYNRHLDSYIETAYHQKAADLKKTAERIKISLQNRDNFALNYPRFIPKGAVNPPVEEDINLNFPVLKENLRNWIGKDIEQGIELLKECICQTGIPLDDIGLATRCIILAGGTSNLSLIEERLLEEFGTLKFGPLEKIERVPPIETYSSEPRRFFSSDKFGREDDASVATAVGNALLAADGGIPTFTCDIGLIVLSPTGQPYPKRIFQEGSPLPIDKPIIRQLPIINRGQEVISIQIYFQSIGYIKGEFEIHVDVKEHTVEISFHVDRYRILRVSGTGKNYPKRTQQSQDAIMDFPIAFRLPEKLKT